MKAIPTTSPKESGTPGDKMPNGKGSLDCCYCIHFRGNWSHTEARCEFHDAVLPATDLNRICCHFVATDEYALHQGAPDTIPPARRFTWFREDFEPGVLYEFQYNNPDRIEKRTSLRVYDYQLRKWTKPRSDDKTSE
jgi:hypothetical protein